MSSLTEENEQRIRVLENSLFPTEEDLRELRGRRAFVSPRDNSLNFGGGRF